jgi:hypothetical protein
VPGGQRAVGVEDQAFVDAPGEALEQHVAVARFHPLGKLAVLGDQVHLLAITGQLLGRIGGGSRSPG